MGNCGQCSLPDLEHFSLLSTICTVGKGSFSRSKVMGSNPNFALNRASRKWARVGKNGQCSLLNFENFLLSNLLLKSILKNKRHLMSKFRNIFLIFIHYLLQYVKLYWIEYVDNYVRRNHRDNPCDRHRRLTAKYIDRHVCRRTDP